MQEGGVCDRRHTARIKRARGKTRPREASAKGHQVSELDDDQRVHEYRDRDEVSENEQIPLETMLIEAVGPRKACSHCA